MHGRIFHWNMFSAPPFDVTYYDALILWEEKENMARTFFVFNAWRYTLFSQVIFHLSITNVIKQDLCG